MNRTRSQDNQCFCSREFFYEEIRVGDQVKGGEDILVKGWLKRSVDSQEVLGRCSLRKALLQAPKQRASRRAQDNRHSYSLKADNTRVLQ